MKVNGNDPSFIYEIRDAGRHSVAAPISNIPIRLEIASRILAGIFASPRGTEDCVYLALNAADALIAAHNETQGGEHE